MKRIINKDIGFAKGSDNDSGSDEPEEKKDSKKKEDKKDDLISMLMGGGDERPESRILMLHSELNEEKSMEIMSTFIALTRLSKPKQNCLPELFCWQPGRKGIVRSERVAASCFIK